MTVDLDLIDSRQEKPDYYDLVIVFLSSGRSTAGYHTPAGWQFEWKESSECVTAWAHFPENAIVAAPVSFSEIITEAARVNRTSSLVDLPQ